MAAGDPGRTGSERTTRRRFLRTIGSLGVVGVAGCASIGGDDGDTSTPPTHSDSGTMGGGSPTETPVQTGRDELTRTGGDGPTPTPTETSTPPIQCSSLPSQPAPLLSFDGVYDGTLTVPTDAESITGTLTNPYLFEVTNGEVTLDPPSDAWTIEPERGTTFGSLDSQATQDVEWGVSVPPTIGDAGEMTVNVAYETPVTNRCGADDADLSFAQPVFITQSALQWETLAVAPDYYEGLPADRTAPGELPGDHIDAELGDPPVVDVELALSEWADAGEFQLKFGDYWPSDGWGALLERTRLVADGEAYIDIEAGTEEEVEYLVEDRGSVRGSEAFDDPELTVRIADEHAFWIYQFPVPEGTTDLAVRLAIANGFRVEGREGLDRPGFPPAVPFRHARARAAALRVGRTTEP